MAKEKLSCEMVACNATHAAFPHGKCLHTEFEKQVIQTPHQIALVIRNEQLTYAQLNTKANQLAHYLIKNNVGPDVVVGLCMTRSLDMLVALLGILKAGGAYLPIDPNFPQQRISYMLKESKVALVLSQADLINNLPESQAVAIPIDSEWKQIAKCKDTNPQQSVATNNLAYVIYTSGSTGKPKGVMIEHHNVMNFCKAMDQHMSYAENAVWLAVTALSFDISVLELIWTLCRGFKVVIYPDGTNNHESIASLMSKHHVSHFQCTPSMAKLLLLDSQMMQLFKGLKQWLIGGEVFTLQLAKNIQAVTNAELINVYGPTETSIWSTLYVLEANCTGVPIGRALVNTQLYILDDNLQQTPTGVPGELYIGGEGVARGYLNRADLTAERFIVNPFSKTRSDKLYKTGDRVCRDANGLIKFIGRTDFQVKIRGNRIEPLEIENALTQISEVDEAVVVAREGNLVAYLVCRRQQPRVLELQQLLAETIPEFMIPSLFVFLDTLPLTANKKIDRQALPVPNRSNIELEKAYQAPISDIEKKLCEIWREYLGIDTIGLNDNFFSLGGHSLSAVQMVFHINQEFNMQLPLQDLFEYPSLGCLAKYIEVLSLKQKHDNQEPVFQLEIDQSNRYEPFPLTHLQRAYWIGRSDAFDLGNIGSQAYVEIQCKKLDVQRFCRAWQKLIERHDMLRLTVAKNGQQQTLQEVPQYHIKQQDLTRKSVEGIDKELNKISQLMLRETSDASQWPLFDMQVSRINEVISHVHMALPLESMDARSMSLLMHELNLFYDDPSATLPILDLTFRDYVIARKALVNSKQYASAKKYWLERIENFPRAPSLPLAKDPSAVSKPLFVRQEAQLKPELWQRLKSKLAERQLTASILLLATYAEVLTAWSNSTQFVINIPIYNRLPLHPQVNDVIGMFSSISLLAVDNSFRDSFEERCKRIQQQLLEDLQHRDFDGIEMMRELALANNDNPGSTIPVVYTSLLDHRFQESFSVLGKVVKDINQTAQVWLDLNVDEHEGQLLLKWDYVAELFPEGFVESMVEAYTHFLEKLAAEDDRWYSFDRHMITAQQSERRYQINATENEFGSLCLHELFAQQVKKHPNKMAIVSGNTRLSYQDVFSQANQLAHLLREYQVKPDELVAIVMNKGWEQVVAVMGILQSGAAYLPIEPEFPSERINFLLNHSKVKIVITQENFKNEIHWPENIRCISLEDDDVKKQKSQALNTIQSQTNLAYVIYTSGSTGLPKGVMIEHHSVVNRILDVNQRFNISSDDKVIAISSLTHDLSVYDIFGMLLTGGCIVIPEHNLRLEPAHWVELIDNEKVTFWNTVPAFMELFINHLENDATRQMPLQKILLSGDWIPVDLPNRINNMFGNPIIISGGGTTETTVWDICHVIQPQDLTDNSIPYGRPMRNAKYYILDKFLTSCPDWVSGEMYLGGAGVARGFWGDEKKTQETFIYHPQTGERLYRCGDLGRFLPSGNIEFLGRADFQIKLQGHRIEPGEIEATIKAHPGVNDALVMLYADSKISKQLVAYIAPKHTGILNEKAIRKFLAKQLPEYMIPTLYVFLDEFPTNNNGKVDRKQLPKPSSAHENIITVFDANDVDLQQVTKIVATVTNKSNTNPSTNLFTLGVDSIEMVMIANSFDREFGFRPRLASLYRAPTITGFTKLLKHYQSRQEKSAHNSQTNIEKAQIILNKVKRFSKEEISKLLGK